MTKIGKCAALVLAVTGTVALAAGAQVVREEGAKSIAGELPAVAAPEVAFAEWTFRSAGGEILFASLDADIYRIMGDHHEVAAIATKSESDGGCSDDGGPGLFRLKVLDAGGNVLCAASRPAPPPGWQRDPRLACTLPTSRNQETYRLRVELAAEAGEDVAPSYPFLLNVSVRAIAPSGVNIQEAFARSGAGGF